MNIRIENIVSKNLVGKRTMMSYSNNKTFDLWRSFMLKRKEIQNITNTDLYSIQIYPPDFFESFNPGAEFEKWAAIEVTNCDSIPEDLEPFILPGGSYAVSLYKGAASAATDTFQYILGTWLQKSNFTLDNRPHFEILGEKYKNEDPDSEEEIWIPIKTNQLVRI
jgi:AraC family transcriptional regulator